ncbi:CASPASE_P20 domain-containing protein [Rubrivivax sp. A210]|uniref:caspase family protein n=1 Tax=Rubrivivax sp. A210 TaxID=2772301 RepID=UPI00191ABA03|nr:caspase family protein [Rubrivivax sp. A210]CAD5373266.1 CASPASE_P20 domain-containing protein [Rubrivivax sp. A210]
MTPHLPILTRRGTLRLGLAASFARAWPAVAQAPEGQRTGPAPEGPRVALVIGNAAYDAAPLPNAANDARAMAALLAEMGFRVVTVRDAGRARMEQALAQARELLAGRGGTGLLYYAGHGLQLDWRNYLLPVDAAPASAAEVPRLAFDIQVALDAFREAGNRMNIVVLDACRDNPFGRSATGRGLAPLDAPPGSFLAYATAPGNVAEDGTAADGNGLYTRFLLQELRRPEAHIEDVFKRVRLQVRRASQGRQVPWESTSLEDDFVFASGAKPPVPPPAEREAQMRRELADWEAVRTTQKADALFDYLQRYPDGWFAEPAQYRLDRLQAPQVLAQADPRLAAPPRPGADRWALGDTLVWEQLDRRSGRIERIEERVTGRDGERVLINGGTIVRDPMGAQLQNAHGRIDPPLLLAPADIAVGKRWRSATRLPLDGGAPWQGAIEARAVALEDIAVPAGSYRAFRVEFRGELVRAASKLVLEETHWLDPATLHVLRQELRWHEDGALRADTSRRLLSFTRQPMPSRPAAPAYRRY